MARRPYNPNRDLKVVERDGAYYVDQIFVDIDQDGEKDYDWHTFSGPHENISQAQASRNLAIQIFENIERARGAVAGSNPPG